MSWRHAEGAGIDLDEGHAASHEHPLRPPAALLALEETGAGQGEGCSTSYRVSSIEILLLSCACRKASPESGAGSIRACYLHALLTGTDRDVRHAQVGRAPAGGQRRRRAGRAPAQDGGRCWPVAGAPAARCGRAPLHISFHMAWGLAVVHVGIVPQTRRPSMCNSW